MLTPKQDTSIPLLKFHNENIYHFKLLDFIINCFNFIDQ
ncbi:hypothetical protein NC99_00130 [Sunxiuqinia dokdonensis]|uniref:Uncharacterized protein n=1 Tax=Sunxiuqinia dokdonensis TaxID=1409788 RepID=A0A0L8VFF0_9BACT|nr:hypothetical protein NC99_00130 [Sunxiuqinia dokdonensis]